MLPLHPNHTLSSSLQSSSPSLSFPLVLTSAHALYPRGDPNLKSSNLNPPPCRTRAKADEAARELQKELSSSAEDATKLNPSFLSPSPFIPMECDLSSFKSIRAFVEDFHKLRLPLDALALNAGVQFSGSEIIQRSTDGYELTIATNHLGHFLLASLLLPDLEASSSSSFSSSSSIANGQKGAPRIVVTASEVHDPASPGGSVGKGAHLGSSQFPGLNPSIQSPMVDGGDWDADKAYKDSKLANVLFASELSRRLKASGSSVTVNSFGPGLITRTGFFRSQNPLFVGLFDFATNEIFKVNKIVTWLPLNGRLSPRLPLT